VFHALSFARTVALAAEVSPPKISAQSTSSICTPSSGVLSTRSATSTTCGSPTRASPSANRSARALAGSGLAGVMSRPRVEASASMRPRVLVPGSTHDARLSYEHPRPIVPPGYCTRPQGPTTSSKRRLPALTSVASKP
jgi:hypothetical protein